MYLTPVLAVAANLKNVQMKRNACMKTNFIQQDVIIEGILKLEKYSMVKIEMFFRG